MRERHEYRGYTIDITTREDQPGEWCSHWTATKLLGSGAHSKSDSVPEAYPSKAQGDGAGAGAARAWIDTFGQH